MAFRSMRRLQIFDAEESDIGSELAEIDENIEVLDNLHAVEIADEEETVSTNPDVESPRGRIQSRYDFSKTKQNGDCKRKVMRTLMRKSQRFARVSFYRRWVQ